MKRFIIPVFIFSILSLSAQSFLIPGGTGGIGSSTNSYNISFGNKSTGQYSRSFDIYGSQHLTAGTSASINLNQVWNGIVYPASIQAKSMEVYANSSAGLIFTTSIWNGSRVETTEKMRITPHGYVGIGTTNPAYKLEVKGTAKVWDHFYVEEGGAVGGAISLVNNAKTGVGQARRWTIYNMAQNYGNSLQFWAYDNAGCPDGLCMPVLGLWDNGNIGIGVHAPGAKLDVAGTIRAYEVKVCLNQGCDFVFEPDYKLMPLKELDRFIATNRHLPEVAPAAVMESEGIDLSEMNAKLLQKIEELTLYIISQDKRIEALENNK